MTPNIDGQRENNSPYYLGAQWKNNGTYYGQQKHNVPCYFCDQWEKNAPYCIEGH